MPNEQQTKPTGGGGSKTIIIIVIIVLALIVLGGGGYFGWKYISSKYLKKNASPTGQKTSSTALTLTQLEEMLKYPNGTVKSTDRSKSAGYASVLEMETSDSIVTANNYYLNLNSDQKWSVVSKSLETDGSRADITYEGTKDKFTVFIIIDKNGEKTEILVRIDAENLPVGTPLGSTSITPANVTPTSTNTPNTSSGDKTTISTDYVITDSDSRVISESELNSFSPWQLKVARNEIYARHGRPFVHKDLQCYFASKGWYTEDNSFSESELSVVENKNIATIKSFEEKIDSPLLSKDTGC